MGLSTSFLMDFGRVYHGLSKIHTYSISWIVPRNFPSKPKVLRCRFVWWIRLSNDFLHLGMKYAKLSFIICRRFSHHLVSLLEIKSLRESPHVSSFFRHEELENFHWNTSGVSIFVHEDMPLQQGPLPMLLAQLLLWCACWHGAQGPDFSPVRCLPSWWYTCWM